MNLDDLARELGLMPTDLPEPHPRFTDRNGDTWNVFGNTAVRPPIADMYAAHKRLTDAELAAEHFAQVAVSAQMDVHALLAGEGPAGEAFFEQSEIAVRQAEILERFATPPHASESDYR